MYKHLKALDDEIKARACRKNRIVAVTALPSAQGRLNTLIFQNERDEVEALYQN